MDVSSFSPVTALTPITLQWCVSMLSNSNICKDNIISVPLAKMIANAFGHSRLWFREMSARRARPACWPTPAEWRRPAAPLATAPPTRPCSCPAAFCRRCQRPTPNHPYTRSSCANTIAATSVRQRPRNWAWSLGARVCWCWSLALAQSCRYPRRSASSEWLFCRHCLDH